jgi:hypothetical protein
VLLRQVCDGCPIPEGFADPNAGEAANAKTTAETPKSFLITLLLSSGRAEEHDPELRMRKDLRRMGGVGFRTDRRLTAGFVQLRGTLLLGYAAVLS